MAFSEAKNWSKGELQSSYYTDSLQGAIDFQEQEQKELKVFKPENMPWENSPQGKLKHLVNESLPLRVRTVNAYIQEIPPGSHSGKHQHMAEECIFILEGKGYDLHWDVDLELKEKFYWTVQSEPQRFDWEAGDIVYIPVNTVHQHFNIDPEKPSRFVACTNRIYKYMGFPDLKQYENAPEYEGDKD